MQKLLLFLLPMAVLIASCKDKDEEPEVQPYVSYASKIVGTWTVVSRTDKGQQSTESYPQAIDDMTVTFKSDSKLSMSGPCNGGGADSYLVSENGSIIINNFKITSIFCGSLENEWESDLEYTLDNVYHSTISGNTLSLESDKFTIKLTK